MWGWRVCRLLIIRVVNLVRCCFIWLLCIWCLKGWSCIVRSSLGWLFWLCCLMMWKLCLIMWWCWSMVSRLVFLVLIWCRLVCLLICLWIRCVVWILIVSVSVGLMCFCLLGVRIWLRVCCWWVMCCVCFWFVWWLWWSRLMVVSNCLIWLCWIIIWSLLIWVLFFEVVLMWGFCCVWCGGVFGWMYCLCCLYCCWLDCVWLCV